ncbi:MAG TPA: hypothetical protein VN278_00855 [Methanosarcina sp.]|nr:hypothetical protein [Methanosarcina sp.]
MHSIKENDSAVVALPFRFTVSSILFAALLLLSSVSVYGFLNDTKEKETLAEVSKLTAAAEQISMLGEGSELELDLRIPDGISVDFGSLPGREDKWPSDANNYCIRAGEKVTFYSSDASFANPELNGSVSLGSGRHRILLSTKTETQSGRLFVLISEKGA